jgi:hypothetical protein
MKAECSYIMFISTTKTTASQTTVWSLSFSSLTIKCGSHIWLTWTDPCRSAGVRLPNWFPCCLGMSGQAGTPFPATCMHSTSQICHTRTHTHTKTHTCISTQNTSTYFPREKKQVFSVIAIITSFGCLPIYHSCEVNCMWSGICLPIYHSLTWASCLSTSTDVT